LSLYFRLYYLAVILLVCPDPPDLEPLARALHQALLPAGILIAIQAVFHRTTRTIFQKAFAAVSFCSRKPLLTGMGIFVAVIGIRLALLPLLRVPVPGIHDEFSYLLMGDTFAHFRLSNPPHPMWISFETFHVNWLPRYASMYPPAQGLVLAVGELLGNPWIGVLLSCAAMCAVIYWMLLAWVPRSWALLGAVITWLKFGVVSYWMNSYWGGAVAAAAGALLIGSIARILRRPRKRDAFLFALALAVLANSRPYEGALFALPSLAVFAHWLVKKGRRLVSPDRWRNVAFPVAAVLLASTACMALYNWRLTGHALLFPHTMNVNTYHSASMFLLGHAKAPKHYNNQQFDDFYNGWEREEYDHTWTSVKCVSWLKSVRIFEAYAWWGMLLALPGAWFVLRKKSLASPWISLALVAFGSYLVVWSNAHYLAPVTGVVILLYVQSLRFLSLLKTANWRWGAILARTSVLLLVFESGYSVNDGECDKFHWTCQGDISRVAVQQQLNSMPGKHLVMVRYDEDHNIHDDWVYNGAEIDAAKVVWAREISSQQDGKLFDYFHDRQVWLVTPDSDNTYLAPYAPPQSNEDK
jgi:hypothetical protein